MTERIEEYTVGELARLSGISVRTLHHYDAVGLLRPRHVTTAGYRLYGRAEAERLQEILCLKALGMTLPEIGAAIDDQADRLVRLRAHRIRVEQQAAELGRVLDAIDQSIHAIEGKSVMSVKDLYAPFSAEKQYSYEQWLAETYGPEMAAQIDSAKTRLKRGVPLDQRMAKLEPIEAALVTCFHDRTVDPSPHLAEHQAWVGEMWGKDCDAAAYAGLADMYLSHPDFVARYELLAEGFSQWLPQAMKDFAAGTTTTVE